MSNLAKLEAKAKALVGTQHWRGLDPDAVLTMCAKLTKARAALEWVDKVVTYTTSWPWAKDIPLFGQIADRVRQTLKEIDE